MTDTTDTAGAAASAARPRPMTLTDSATAYLRELRYAADLAQFRHEEAVLTERSGWMTTPFTWSADSGPHGALNSPALHVHNYRHSRQHAEINDAARDIGRVAWWYASAALAALDAVLSGREITARRLETLTVELHRIGADDDPMLPWAPCYRPQLPGEGELRTGVAALDERIDRALTPLREAYAAAVGAEEIWADVDAPAEDDDGEQDMADHEAAALHRYEHTAAKIPELLITAAEEITVVAHQVPRRVPTA